MEETIETTVLPDIVWDAWERAHHLSGSRGIKSGDQGKSKKFPYKIIEVEKGKHFSILWKTLFVRLIFTHKVIPISTGSKITFQELFLID